MDIFAVISLIGGLAMFLYGMNVMGESLEKLAGGKLEKIFEKLTSNRLKGLLLGMTVTAVVQSSSTTTVMLVGFVNSGIMKLSQAISIIMGANIGTTITSWILSLSGLESDNFFIKMLKPSSFAPIIALIGIILVMSKKNDKTKVIGNALLGFAILMTGMSTMSSSVEPLAEIPEFKELLAKFSNPVLGVLVGAILTAVIQSSAASVGMLQSLSNNGLITFGSAIPIILGQNIGTCATALLSCIGANKNAKRVAVVHLYFNVIGTVVFLIGFYALNSLLEFAFLNDAITSFNVAIVHTIFNLVTTIIMFPMINILEKLAYLTVKDTEEKEEIQMLDERLLNTPTVALEQARNVTIKMAEKTIKSITLALDVFKNYDSKKADKVVVYENMVDAYEDRIGSYLLKLSSRNLTETDSKSTSELLHVIGDFERISDHAMNIIEISEELHSKKNEFSNDAYEELMVLMHAITDVLDMTAKSFANNDINLAHQVEPLEEVIDRLRLEMRNRHIQRLKDGKCTMELGFIFTDLLTELERVSDHCSNIAVCMIQIEENNAVEVHEYLNVLSKDSEFEKQCQNFATNYKLPKQA
ncbi:MAG: Na/Pi cotransporter family protein [Ruminococcus sp.]|nr:Na/Pi cotransporter family protein [Ruminococcus sp.]